MNEKTALENSQQPKLRVAEVSGSALIAEFDGWVKEVDGNKYWKNKLWKTEPFLGYDKEWNRLMPVVEKIELECKYDVHIYAHYNWKEPNRCSIVDWKNNKIVNTYNDSKFQCVFDAVVEFVKWWNAKQADR